MESLDSRQFLRLVKNILIPVGFWEATPIVVEEGARIAEAFGATVRLLHVAAQPSLVTYKQWPQELRDQRAQELRETRSELQALAQRVEQRGVEVKAHLFEGDTSTVILEQAMETQADLIVMGSHGHGLLLGALMGNVTADVLRKAPCPVLVIPASVLKVRQKAIREATSE